MLSFNEQLLDVFFYQKKVQYNSELFNHYYYSIFPSPQLFVNFLSSTNREEQTLFAKQIIKRMCFCKYNSVLFDLYKNLIDLEETNLINEPKLYIPREHSIHSVNTYLLGIFLYFSFGIFNKQLNLFFSNIHYNKIFCSETEENAFLCFLDCWKIFSLNHDIGYPLELLIDSDGKLIEKSYSATINKLNSISESMVVEYAKNELVFLIGLQIITDNSDVKLSETLSSKEFDIIKKINSDYLDYVRIENIYTYNIFSYYQSAFEFEHICFKVLDTETNEQYFWYSTVKDSSTLISHSLSKDVSEHITVNKMFNANYHIEIFYPHAKCKELPFKSLSQFTPYSDDIKKAATEILSQNTISYAGISDEQSYFDFLFDIYESVESNLSLINRKPSKQYYKQFSKEFISFLSNNIICNYSDSLINYEESILENLHNIYNNALDFLKDPSNLQSTIENFLLSKNSAVSYNLLPIYNHIESHYRTLLTTCNNSLFLDIKKDMVTKKTSNRKFDKFIQELIIAYGNISKNSNLILKETDAVELTNYTPSYSSFDHGVASCFIVLETYYKALKIKKSNLPFEQSGILIPNKKIMETASFSILVHNVYVPFLNKLSNGKQIKHDIIKNPFVYFCLFCDNMQIWDRPYRLNQGKLELETTTVSSKDIAIFPTGNKICVQCVTLDAEKVVSNYRKDLDMYLKDGSKLISLNLLDKY